MIATFWDALFELADKAKEEEEEGEFSVRYKTIHEVENVLQKVYDDKNKFTEKVLNAKPKNEVDAMVFGIDNIKVTDDGEGYYHYELDGLHFDTASEVLYYMIDDRKKQYGYMNRLYDSVFARAVEESASKLFNKACADFHEEIDGHKPRLRKCKFDSVSEAKGIKK